MSFRRFLFATLAFILSGPSYSAEFSIVLNGEGWDSATSRLVCNVRMTGEVQTGDSAKLTAALTSIEGFTKTLCLDSPGGSYDEALGIAALLIEKRVATVLEKNRKCFSACSIIFMSGVMPTGAEEWARPAREMHATAELGFHAPYLPKASIPSGAYDSGSIIAAYQTALKGLRKLMLLNSQDSRIKGELMPVELILEMLDREPDQLFLVDTVGRAVKFRIDVVGTRAIAKVSEAALCNVCLNLFDQSPEASLCKDAFVRRRKGTISFSIAEELGECRLASVNVKGKTVWHVEEGPVTSKPIDWSGRDSTIQSWWMFPPRTRLKDIAGP